MSRRPSRAAKPSIAALVDSHTRILDEPNEEEAFDSASDEDALEVQDNDLSDDETGESSGEEEDNSANGEYIGRDGVTRWSKEPIRANAGRRRRPDIVRERSAITTICAQ